MNNNENTKNINKIYKVFISSTYLDNVKRIKVVEEAVQFAGMIPVGMNYLTANTHPTVEVCKQLVQDCDLMIGIVGHRYGWIPKGQEKSITEIEYDAATEKLMFLLDESIPINPNTDFDPLPERWEKQKKLELFRLRIKEDQMPAKPFTDDNLGSLVLASLEKWRKSKEKNDSRGKRADKKSSKTNISPDQPKISTEKISSPYMINKKFNISIKFSENAKKSTNKNNLERTNLMEDILNYVKNHPKIFITDQPLLPFIIKHSAVLVLIEFFHSESLVQVLDVSVSKDLDRFYKWVELIYNYHSLLNLPYRKTDQDPCEILFIHREWKRVLKAFENTIGKLKEFFSIDKRQEIRTRLILINANFQYTINLYKTGIIGENILPRPLLSKVVQYLEMTIARIHELLSTIPEYI